MLTDAVESIAEGFALYDRDDRLVLFNQKYRELFPLSADAIVPGARFEDILRFGAQRGQYRDAVGREEAWVQERVKAHHKPEAPREIQLGDGRWVRVTEYRTKAGGIAGLRVDITELKKREEALRRSEERYALAMKGANDGLWEWDIENKKTYRAPRVLEILGLDLTFTESGPEWWLSRVHPDDLPRYRRAIRDHLKGLTDLYECEYRVLDNASEYRWVLDRAVAERDETGWARRMAGSIRDITARKEIEEALHESEQRYASIVANVPGVVYQRILDPDGTISYPYVSEGIRAIYGVTPEAVQNDPALLLSAIHPIDRDRFMAAVHTSAETLTPMDIEIRIIGADGGTRWIHSRTRPTRRADGGIVWDGLLLDVTERKQAEESIKEREQRLKAIMDNAADGVITICENGIVESMSAQALKMFGYAPEEIIGQSVNVLMPEPDRSHHDEYIRRYLTTNRPKIIGIGPREVVARRKDGSLFPMELAVSELWLDHQRIFIGVTRDATLRKQREKDLRAKTEQLQVIADITGAFLATGNWQQTNEKLVASALKQSESAFGFVGVVVKGPALRILHLQGITWDGQINRDFYEKALATFREKGYLDFANFDNLFGTVLTTKQPVLSNDPASDPRSGGVPPGHPRLECFLGVPMMRGDDVVGMIGVANRPGGYGSAEQEKLETLARMAAVLYDSYRRAESHAETEEQLRQSQKMEAVGQLTGGIAHDFNNLLTVILGNAEMLSDELAKNSRHQRMAKTLQMATERAAELTRGLLAFSRRQTLAPVVLDLNEVVSQMNGLLRRTLGEHIEIVVETGADLWPVEADRAQLESAILNLAVNARDAMPKGGRLTIKTANVVLGQHPITATKVTEPGSYVELAVTDTGVGMPSEVRERVFEPFFTTKEVGKGTGLGLSMVYGFIKQSGGYVTIDSAPGEGTTVKLYLPQASGATAATGTAESVAVPTGTETVLVVEDDPLVRDYVTGQITRLGYRVVAASDGPSALAELAKPIPVDLLYTDMVMPGGMNGKQLADEARRRRPGLKVLFTSGYAENVIAESGGPDVIADILAKPYTKEQLAKKLRATLDRG
jgi:PAS domain S-box-containing protein